MSEYETRFTPLEFIIPFRDSIFKSDHNPFDRLDRLIYHMETRDLEKLLKDPIKIISIIEQEVLQRKLNNKRRSSYYDDRI